MRNKETRTAQVLIDGTWTDIHYMNLKKGHVFRLFESDGTLVVDNNYSVFVVENDIHFDLFSCRTIIDCYPAEDQSMDAE